MKESKYVLIVFNDPRNLSEQLSGDFEPKEAPILKEVTTGSIMGISCGVMNFCAFPSDKSMPEISRMLTEKNIDFYIFKEEDSLSRIPSFIAKAFRSAGAEFKEESEKPKKLTLQDQLDEAVRTENWEMAAKIRDKIKNVKEIKKVKANSTDPLKDFFSDL
jgi:hypothetical protein